MSDTIKIKGAKEHNLKDVSLEIPKNELVVFTGVSGSGKSSLAFDTIFAEGQRRYIESLSTYARQFLGQMDKPDVEYIDGLSPAISIDQKSTSNNPRSTVGTVTEIYDYLRLLYARVGTPHCPQCGEEIRPQTIDEIVTSIMKLGEGTKIQILAPIIRGKKGEYQSLFEVLRQEGFVRVKVDGEIYNLDEDEIELAKTKKHDISVVVDRIVVKPEAQSRIADSVGIALHKADGIAIAEVVGKSAEGKNQEIIFSEKLACPNCNISFEELAPRIFSFNNPYGACERCSGIGVDYEISPDLVVPDRTKSINDGAIYPWDKSSTSYYKDMLAAVCSNFGINPDTPFEDLPKEHQNIILYGSPDIIKMKIKGFTSKRYETRYHSYPGVIPYLMKKYHESDADYWREEIEKYMVMTPCKSCKGARLKPFPLAVTIKGKNIYEFTQMSILQALDFIEGLRLSIVDAKISNLVLKVIKNRLSFLKEVGLEYLTLSRSAGTLSGGEAQRIRLATQIGSGLSGVLYILDEPSIGLHQRDNDKLLATLKKLRDLGNTLIVVEHDEDTMYAADQIIDIGPGAGVHGGNVMAQGTAEEIKLISDSITGQYLSGRKQIPVPKKRRKPVKGKAIEVIGASEHNLKNVIVDKISVFRPWTFRCMKEGSIRIHCPFILLYWEHGLEPDSVPQGNAGIWKFA